jgi:phosphate transport system substrate-binding protein
MKISSLICGIMSTAVISVSGAEETIKIGGMGSGLGVIKIMGKAYEKKHPGTKVRVLPSLGSTGGIKGVAKGALDIGISARPFRGEEKSYGLSTAEYAKTPLVIVTRINTRAVELTTEDLVRIYEGSVLSWEDGRRIRPVLRPEEDIDTQIVKELSPEMKKAIEIAMSRKGMLIAITDQDATNTIQKTPGALGFSTLAQVITEKLPLKILSLNGVFPTAGALSNGSYRPKKALFLVTRPKSSPRVEDFLNFVRSQAGVKILEESGYVVTLQKAGQ